MRLFYKGYVDVEEDAWFDVNVPDEVTWFFDHVANKDLILHSNEVGDALGDFVVWEVYPIKEE